MDVRPGATVVYKKERKQRRRNKNNMRHSYDSYYGNNSKSSINMIPSFNVYDEQDQNVMRSKEEYEYQRKRERKIQKKRNKAIDDKWAKQNEEQLIKQLEEQKRIMNLRYKVAKHRLEKRSRIGAVAANTYKPTFTRDTLISMYNSNSSGADDYDEEEEMMNGNYYEHSTVRTKSKNHSDYKYANNVLNYDQIQGHGEKQQQQQKYGLKEDEEFLEATSLADLPSDLFNPPPKKTDTKTNPRRRGGGGGDGIGRRGNNQLSNSLPSGLNLIGSTTTGTNQFSNGTLDNVLPNINDVLNLAGMNENFDDFNEDVDVSNTKKSPLLPN